VNGSSVAAVRAAVSWEAYGEHAEAAFALGDILPNDLHEAVAVLEAVTEKTRNLLAAHKARAERLSNH
jgi:hypothetical protein